VQSSLESLYSLSFASLMTWGNESNLENACKSSACLCLHPRQGLRLLQTGQMPFLVTGRVDRGQGTFSKQRTSVDCVPLTQSSHEQTMS
jgi:hypothetical protein